MFGIDALELLVIIIVLIIVVEPKDMPRMVRTLGKAMVRVRAAIQDFRDHLDDVIHEANMQDIENTLHDVEKHDLLGPLNINDIKKEIYDEASPILQYPGTLSEENKSKQ
ncbi:MAG: sec-independent protein translocase protein TatB [Candidatus Tokpelaia sp. JSC188]|nr:MAG: sec-independent protein translocase protein TatB [Candidatus Tokpelaia sp. JSC188]